MTETKQVEQDAALETLMKKRFAAERMLDELNTKLYFRSKRLIRIRKRAEIRDLTRARDEAIAQYEILLKEAKALWNDTKQVTRSSKEDKQTKELIKASQQMEETIQMLERDVKYLNTKKI